MDWWNNVGTGLSCNQIMSLLGFFFNYCQTDGNSFTTSLPGHRDEGDVVVAGTEGQSKEVEARKGVGEQLDQH